MLEVDFEEIGWKYISMEHDTCYRYIVAKLTRNWAGRVAPLKDMRWKCQLLECRQKIKGGGFR